jgi:hypothetical protein
MIVLTDSLIEAISKVPAPDTYYAKYYKLILIDCMSKESSEIDLMAVRTVDGWKWAIKL